MDVHVARCVVACHWCGVQDNAVKAICPAMIDVLLHTLARETMTVSGTGADGRDGDDGLAVKELAINVFIAMVQVLVLKPSSKVCHAVLSQ